MKKFDLAGLLLVLFLALGHPAVLAQNATAAVQVWPSTGLWWSPGENGQFLQLAIGPGGYVLATLTESDAQGQPSYRVLQGPYQAYDPNSGEGIGRVASNFYLVRDASCIACGPANGRTVDSGRLGILRFRDGTHLELLDAARVVRRYELFPLLRSERELTATRVEGRRFAMTVGGVTEVVRLEAQDPIERCADPGSALREFRLRFAQTDSRLAAGFADLVIQIGAGINPAVVAKVDVRKVQRICVRPLFGGCAEFREEVLGSQCAVAYRFSESYEVLRGVAVPDAGSDLAFPGLRPLGAARFRGALTLQPLPMD